MLECADSAAPILEVQGLRKVFSITRGFMGGQRASLTAVDDVSFGVAAGEAFGLVGESGCGKSTVGRCLLRLIEPTAGRVRYRGQDLAALPAQALRPLRRKLQIVFQDPYSSLNPRRTVGQTLVEPLRVHGVAKGRAARDRVAAVLTEVGLAPEAADRFPHEFSGGQRQRIAIARALILEPELIVADEAVSALDVSIQAQILLLLKDLKARHGLSFVFISHDLGVVRYFCHRVAVMYLGRLVETGPVPAIFDTPLHPYTETLRNASPVPDPANKVTMRRLDGEVPSPTAPPPGCHFHPRCPKAMDVCRTTPPAWTTLSGGRGAACHLHG